MHLKGGNGCSGISYEEGIRGSSRGKVKMMGKKAIILLSGGIDSCVTAAILRSEGYEIYTITFTYGQKHLKETEQASKVAETLGSKQHLTINIDFLKRLTLGYSALTDESIALPTAHTAEEVLGRIKSSGVPVSYVPMRNTILLSIAAAYAETIGADVIAYGANNLDYSGYPDCRPEYVSALEKTFALGSKRGDEGNPISIKTPLMFMGKAEIIKKGIELGAPLHLTWSCYSGGERPCGICDSCLLRAKGFKEAGVEDLAVYEK